MFNLFHLLAAFLVILVILVTLLLSISGRLVSALLALVGVVGIYRGKLLSQHCVDQQVAQRSFIFLGSHFLGYWLRKTLCSGLEVVKRWIRLGNLIDNCVDELATGNFELGLALVEVFF